jgi:hypothetical protein
MLGRRRGPGITLEPTISPVQGRTRPVTRCGVSLAFLLDFNRTLPSADMSTLDVVYKVGICACVLLGGVGVLLSLRFTSLVMFLAC